MGEHPRRPKMSDINPQIICILCGGYYVDATTIIECMHSYCRACIVAYLRQSKQCPTCDILVHKSRPMQKLRPDQTLQKLVYKMVPDLYRDETKRRRVFHMNTVQRSGTAENGQPSSADSTAASTKICDDSIIIYTHDEMFNLSLEYYQPSASATRAKSKSKVKSDGVQAVDKTKPTAGTGTDINGNSIPEKRDVDTRYLRCPAPLQVSHLKKFIRSKFGLSQMHKVHIVHRDGRGKLLQDRDTLMDIAYIYSWKRVGPLPLIYRVCEHLPANKRMSNDVIKITSKKATNGEPTPKKSVKIKQPIKVAISKSQPPPVLVT